MSAVLQFEIERNRVDGYPPLGSDAQSAPKWKYHTLLRCALADTIKNGGTMIPTRDTAAYLSLSQTMRRLAHSARREALKWAADGNLKNYITMRHECDRLWQAAKFYLLHAKIGAGK